MAGQTRIIAKQLKNSLLTDEYAQLSKTDVISIEVATLKFLIKMLNSTQYSKILKKYIPSVRIKNFKKSVMNTFESVISFKMVCICVLQNKQTISVAKENFNANGFYFDLISYIRANEKELVKRCLSLDHDYNNVKDIDRVCKNLTPEFVKHSKKTVYMMRFVAKSNNIEWTDLAASLNEKAVALIWNQIPFISGEHLIRSTKRTIKNEGINLIKFYTAAKRKRLNSTADGYNNTIVSIDMVNYDDSGGEDQENRYIYKNISDMNCTDERNMLNTKLSLHSFIERQSKQPIKKKILDLMLMKNDPEFIQFLKEKGLKLRTQSTVEDAFRLVGNKRYLELIREYTDATNDHFYRFVEHLRQEVVEVA